MTDVRGLTMLAPPSRVLSEHIAEQVRTAILTDQLKAGQRIAEGEIAELMQTSRGPVRDALLLLEKEGLVVHHPHRGAFVAELSLRDAEEVYSLRQAIEALAVEYVIKRATPEQFDELDELVERMAALTSPGYDLYEAIEVDLAFHRALCRVSGHKRVLDAWEALCGQVRVLLLGHRMRNPRDFEERAVNWHRQLVAALRQGDSQGAQRELRRHLAATVEGLVQGAAADPSVAESA